MSELTELFDVFFNGRPAHRNGCTHPQPKRIRTPAPERHLITLCFDCGWISWDWTPKVRPLPKSADVETVK